jgi:hypothetical protein
MPTILCTISSELIELALQRLPKILLVPVCYILPVLMPSSLLYLPSMTSIHCLLNMINIVKQQLDYKESLQKVQVEISQLSKINTNQIDRWLVQPNLKLQMIKFYDKSFEDQFPKIQRKFYLFETRDLPTPPKTFVHFLEKCIECISSKEGETSTKQ